MTTLDELVSVLRKKQLNWTTRHELGDEIISVVTVIGNVPKGALVVFNDDDVFWKGAFLGRAPGLFDMIFRQRLGKVTDRHAALQSLLEVLNA